MRNLYSTNVRTPQKSGGVDRNSVTSDNGFSVNPYTAFWGYTHMVHRYTRTPLYSTTCKLPKIPVESTGFPFASSGLRLQRVSDTTQIEGASC